MLTHTLQNKTIAIKQEPGNKRGASTGAILDNAEEDDEEIAVVAERPAKRRKPEPDEEVIDLT